MEARVSPRVISFVMAVKKHLFRHRLTLDQFLSAFKLNSPRYISQQEFIRIVQRINEGGESFNPLLLFAEFAKGASVIPK
jgi:hypothetical protein